MLLAGVPDAATDLQAEAQCAWHGNALRGTAIHAVFGYVRRAAHTDRDASRQPLHHPVVVRDDNRGVTVFIGDGHGRTRDPVDVERLHLELGERATHSIRVHHG